MTFSQSNYSFTYGYGFWPPKKVWVIFANRVQVGGKNLMGFKGVYRYMEYAGADFKCLAINVSLDPLRNWGCEIVKQGSPVVALG